MAEATDRNRFLPQIPWEFPDRDRPRSCTVAGPPSGAVRCKTKPQRREVRCAGRTWNQKEEAKWCDLVMAIWPSFSGLALVWSRSLSLTWWDNDASYPLTPCWPFIYGIYSKRTHSEPPATCLLPVGSGGFCDRKWTVILLHVISHGSW